MSTETEPSFSLSRPSRRTVSKLLVLGLAGTALGMATYQDHIDSDEEFDDQFNLLAVSDTFGYMSELNIDPGEEPLYGHYYPTLGEAAAGLFDVLPQLSGDAARKDYTLTIVEESKPVHLMRRIKQLIGREPKSHSIVQLEEYDSGSTLYLPPYFPKKYPAERALDLYETYLSLLAQPYDRSENPFEAFNYVWVGRIHMTNLLLNTFKKPVGDYNPEELEIYLRAIKNDDTKEWEDYVKENFDLEPSKEIPFPVDPSGPAI